MYGKAITSLMKANDNMSMLKLANKSKLNYNTVMNACKDKGKLQSRVKKELSRALGVTVSELEALALTEER
jgi:hypothetical protein